MTRIKTTPEQIKRELQNLVEVSLHEALRRVFSRVEKNLFNQAENVREKAARKALFSAIAHGRTGQKKFYQAVFQQLLDPNIEQNAPKQWFELTQDRGAALKLEDNLHAACRSTSGEHAQYLARIHHLTELTDQIPDGLYSLEAIARAVLEQSTQLPSLMQKPFVNIFIEQGVRQISPIYSILNDYLIQVGILPTLKRLTSSDNSSETPAVGGITSSTAFVEAMIDRVSELLEEQISGEPTATFDFDQDSDWTVSHFSRFIKQQIAPDLPDAHWPAKPADIIHVVGVTLADILNDSM
ncbi:MAG TPA: DUF1631 family protein, partial [Halothiobacillaceae bacterium]|nr:DUF1631 family protein [Halothiobacillaceae bacterium]